MQTSLLGYAPRSEQQPELADSQVNVVLGDDRPNDVLGTHAASNAVLGGTQHRVADPRTDNFRIVSPVRSAM